MDLRTGCPIWLLTGGRRALATGPLAEDIRCRVAIVGGGVTGALLADRLTRDGVDTVLIDARTFAAGSTVASTNILLREPDTSLAALAERLGTSSARRVYELGSWAIDQIDELTGGLPDRCDYRRQKSLYLGSESSDVEELDRDFELCERLAIPMERLERDDLARAGYSVNSPLALRSPIAADVDGYRFTFALIQRALAAGLRAYSKTQLAHVEHSTHDGLQLRTSRGCTIRADAVVFATGYEAHEQLDARLGSLASTWAMATRPVAAFEGWPGQGPIWESARPYCYLRTTIDGRVIIGGLDEPGTESHQDVEKMRSKAMQLANRFRTIFPAIPIEIETAWAGVFGSSVDGLPYIGRPDSRRPIYYALGYGGNGITFSVIAMALIAEELAGRRHEDAQLFRFDRG